MSDESVPDWNAVIHKNVRTSDGMPAENIVAIDEEGIHIESNLVNIYKALENFKNSLKINDHIALPTERGRIINSPW